VENCGNRVGHDRDGLHRVWSQFSSGQAHVSNAVRIYHITCARAAIAQQRRDSNNRKDRWHTRAGKKYTSKSHSAAETTAIV
jgi:hypothetical protein